MSNDVFLQFEQLVLLNETSISCLFVITKLSDDDNNYNNNKK